MTAALAEPERLRPWLEVAELRQYLHSDQGLVRAVDGVTFDVHVGESFGLVGESGSGKTVLARSIARLLPRSAIAHTSGSIRLAGVELINRSPRRMRELWGREIGFVFQDSATALNPVMKIGSQIVEAIKAHSDISSTYARESALDLMASMRLAQPRQKFEAYPHELSGGMRQRVVIAIALASNPRLLIADEPTTALDVTVQSQILDLLKEEQERRGMSMILISHDIASIAGRTDRSAVMYAGRIVESGPSIDMFTDPRMPYTSSLLKSIPSVNRASHSRLEAIPGAPPDLTQEFEGCPFAPRCHRVQPRCAEDPQETIEGSRTYRCWCPVGSYESQSDTQHRARASEPNRGW